MKKGFTMIELIFVIIVIGILSAIAIPKFSETHDLAVNAKGLSVLNNVRTALVVESQKRVLSADSNAITSLSSGGKVFDKFNADQDGVKSDILLYPVASCTSIGCWSGSGKEFKYHLPSGGTCTFKLVGDKFNSTSNCPQLKE